MRPRSSRTGTAQWRKVRAQRLAIDFENGVTRCPMCKVHLDYEYTLRPNSAEPDHIVPHAQGGQDVLENTRTICRNCNQRSGGKLGRSKQLAEVKRIIPETKIEW